MSAQLTPEQVGLVKNSWEQVVPIADTAAKLFYERLFELDPELRPLFRTNITEQGRKLMQMITAAVRGLDNMPALLPVLQDLGRRHVKYGVRRKDYDTVGAALLWTLEQGLGAGFTPQVRAAWTTLYSVLASVMQAAATEQLTHR
jgi:hemoglobin-like flavoprotein